MIKFKKFNILLIFTIIYNILILSPGSALAWTHTDEIKADAIYRTGAYGYYHTGVIYCGSIYRAYECRGDGPVTYSTMDSFIGDEDYLGSYYSSTVDTESERDAIIDTADDIWLYNESLSYTWADCLNPVSGDIGSYISFDEIDELRCDGLVEYAYEWNNFWVWGRTSDGTQYTSPTHFDISYVGYYDEHNNLGKDDPWFELSPYVQKGSAGTTWTKLRAR
jgi:hypothetical protein